MVPACERAITTEQPSYQQQQLYDLERRGTISLSLREIAAPAYWVAIKQNAFRRWCISCDMLVLALAVALVTEWAVISVSTDVPCAPRSYGPTRMVCVCNSTHCDTVDKPTPLPKGQFLWYTSNREGLRFHKTTGSFLPNHCTERYLVHCLGYCTGLYAR
uniref:Uncharacterized protein n=1 Tax=Timema genevievae TaxID=629358 RepID=A0A7R9K4G2_TIMGE|nr:unnamed protein product [Timema genevievae]